MGRCVVRLGGSSMNSRTLDRQTLDDIIQRIVAVAQPDKIILFGSRRSRRNGSPQ